MLKNGLAREVILSDALCMLDLFRDWSSVGTADSPFASDGRFLISAESSVVSDNLNSNLDSDSFHIVDRTRLGKIRGESLRCLYFLIRSRSEDLVGQWCTLVLNSGARQGLCHIATNDIDVHARRFALYSVLALFRSETVRRLLPSISCNYSTWRASVSDDLSKALPEVFGMVEAFVKSADADDQSSIATMLPDFVLTVSHQSKVYYMKRLLDLLLARSKHVDPEIASKFIIAAAHILPHLNLTLELAEELQSRVVEFPLPVLAVNVFLSKISAQLIQETLISDLVVEGLKSLCTNPPVEETIIEAVFLNCMYVKETIPILNGMVANLAVIESPETSDAIWVGLGKLSRQSLVLTATVLASNEHVLKQRGEPSVKRIQALGDLYFSAYQIGSDSFTDVMENKLIEWFMDEKYQWATLRVIMTGLVRMKEALTDCERIAFLEKFQTCLLQIWLQEISGKVRSDSYRTIGLLYELVPFSKEFSDACTQQLDEALNSGKNKLILNALFTISKFTVKQGKHTYWSSPVITTIKAVAKDLAKGLSNGHARETEFVVGSLHVITQSLHILLQCSVIDLAKDCMNELLEDKRLAMMENKEPAIAKHVLSIRKLII